MTDTQTLINLGDRARDKISGFTGIVVGRCRYLSGCDQVLLGPPVGDDGTYRDSQWFDIDRCELLDEAVFLPDHVGSLVRPGGDRPAPKR